MDVEVELEKNVRRFRETFHGKIAVDKATILMRRYRNNHHMVAMEIILMKDRDLDDEDRQYLRRDQAVMNVVRRLTAEERQAPPLVPPAQAQARATTHPQDDEDIKELGRRLAVLPLTEKNKLMFDNAQRNHTPSAVHLFACQACDKDWWRRVPLRKRVSRCHLCKQKYDPVPPNKMWGIGQFNCLVCARVFRGFGRMDLGSPCYGCRSLVTPSEILPPLRVRGRAGGPGRARNPHSCLAEDCFNRQEPHVPGTECVHPRSRQLNRKPRVVNPSPPHHSSGSTVNTCLSQGSLANLEELILDDIQEESEEEDQDGSSRSSSS